MKLTSKGDSRLPIPLRRIKIRREKGGKITLLTNDLARSAVEIAALYKSRWQIELLFRWIKQHLDIRKFLGAKRQRDPPSGARCDDCLPAAAHRRSHQLHQNAPAQVRRTRRPAPAHASIPRCHRQTSAHQPQPSEINHLT
ncbi:hypothetical protein ACVILK_005312 [Bradyrhizobium embrapense]